VAMIMMVRIYISCSSSIPLLVVLLVVAPTINHFRTGNLYFKFIKFLIFILSKMLFKGGQPCLFDRCRLPHECILE
jgi:ABC-type amino acid transport system permease subunit